MNCKRSASALNKIKEHDLVRHELEDDYDVVHLLGEGSFARVQLATHRHTGCTVALKSVHKSTTKYTDFLREFHYNYYLSPHVNILISYDVAFQTRDAFVFAQEFAPCGDLATMISTEGEGLNETKTKLVMKQIASALDFMHSKQLVHRDVKAQNVLVFRKDASLVKLTDFGLTRTTGTLVKKDLACPPSVPPEVCDAIYNEGYHVEVSSDAWQLAMLGYFCLKNSLPWMRADITDSNYTEFAQWQKRKSTRTPNTFKPFTPRFHRLCRRMLEAKPEKRAPVREVFKYLNDKWMIKDGKGKESASSRGSKTSQEEKTGLGKMLMKYGVEINADRESRIKRVTDWVFMPTAE